MLSRPLDGIVDRADSQRHADVNRVSFATQQRGERQVQRLGPQVPEGHLHKGLGHVMRTPGGATRLDGGGAVEALAHQLWDQHVSQMHHATRDGLVEVIG